MNLIDVCILTISVSTIMKIRFKLELYKEIAGLGYKFNIDNLEKYKEDVEKEKIKNIPALVNMTNKVLTLIPFLNLIDDMIRESAYYNNQKENIEILIEKNILEKMTEEEIKDYNDYKIGLYAVIMEKRRRKKINVNSIEVVEPKQEEIEHITYPEVDNIRINQEKQETISKPKTRVRKP